MAVYEHKGIMRFVDENGDVHILYPATEGDCVVGSVDNSAKVRGVWFAFEDADGNPTDELYAHWYEDENGNIVTE